MSVATNHPMHQRWPCRCKIPVTDHALDWHRREETRTQWRHSMMVKYTKKLCSVLNSNRPLAPTTLAVTNQTPLAIIDDKNPPFPHSNLSSKSCQILPTDARIRQKDRLMKLKVAGLKPKKKNIHTEPGQDDCGDDISGLGSDIHLLGCDTIPELFSDD